MVLVMCSIKWGIIRLNIWLCTTWWAIWMLCCGVRVGYCWGNDKWAVPIGGVELSVVSGVWLRPWWRRRSTTVWTWWMEMRERYCIWTIHTPLRHVSASPSRAWFLCLSRCFCYLNKYSGSTWINFAVPKDTYFMTCDHTENLLLGKKLSFWKPGQQVEANTLVSVSN